jgi:Zn-dependent protease with chaperone function
MKLPRRGCHVAPQVSGRALAPEERGRLVREYLYAHRRAQAMVGQLASALSVPKPGVRIVHDPAVPPGYASLDVKANTVVVPMATARLRDDHLRAVLAHEVAHLRPSREIYWFCGLLCGVGVATLGTVLFHTSFPGQSLLVPVCYVLTALTPLGSCFLFRREEISADITSAHLTGPVGAEHFTGQLGWIEWPSTRLHRWLVRPFRGHPWPPRRVRAYRRHAWRERCPCRKD